jgi:hypothetical protein
MLAEDSTFGAHTLHVISVCHAVGLFASVATAFVISVAVAGAVPWVIRCKLGHLHEVILVLS